MVRIFLSAYQVYWRKESERNENIIVNLMDECKHGDEGIIVEEDVNAVGTLKYCENLK